MIPKGAAPLNLAGEELRRSLECGSMYGWRQDVEEESKAWWQLLAIFRQVATLTAGDEPAQLAQVSLGGRRVAMAEEIFGCARLRGIGCGTKKAPPGFGRRRVMGLRPRWRAG